MRDFKNMTEKEKQERREQVAYLIETEKAPVKVKRKKPGKKAQENAAKRAILKEYFGDDPDFVKVIMEDYKL